MNWVSIQEGFIANVLADIVIALFAITIITKKIKNAQDKKETIGALILLSAEIKLNEQILKTALSEGICAFEKERRKNKVVVRPSEFVDAKNYINTNISSIRSSNFESSYAKIGTLNNKMLLEKILNLYLTSYHYKLKMTFKMDSWNWKLVDETKKVIEQTIRLSREIDKDIIKEVQRLRGKKKFFEDS